MRAVVAGLLLATAWLAEPPAAAALSVQEAILRAKPGVALVTAEIRADVTMNCGHGPVEVSPAPFVETGTVKPVPRITVMLSNGTKLTAQVKKFSPPLLLDNNNRPLPDSGRDLALLRVKDGVYPAIALAKRDSQIGDPVHILGFPGVVLSHELLNKSAALEASVTN